MAHAVRGARSTRAVSPNRRPSTSSSSTISRGSRAWNSRTFPVKLDLPADSGLRPGQFVRLSVPVGESGVVLIPPAALLRRGQLEIVFVSDGGIARLRLVRTGRTRTEGIEVLAGLDGTESVAVTGVDRLRDGQPLKILP